MHSIPARRVIGILVLLVCLFGLMVWFGSLAPNPTVGAYPSTTELGTEYDVWIGERASFTGTVVETDPLTISAEYGAGERVNLHVSGTNMDVQEGNRLAVFGVVEEDHTIHAENAYTVPSSNYLYMYVVSFLASVWVLGRFIRTWRLDWANWSLEPRATPRRVSNISFWSNEREEQDA